MAIKTITTITGRTFGVTEESDFILGGGAGREGSTNATSIGILPAEGGLVTEESLL